ncbi:MAG: hypothetical protein FWC16_11940 [Defluviitaleaceae bacterium]|nr:hypothetical protein [Defluviitaleaceae bacterium]MCL2275629.1 hypothetical protein [Defluviitaleaceae bacterium]
MAWQIIDSAKHILRSPIKSLLILVVSLFFTVLAGLMVDALRFFEQEVERLYNTTVVSGEVRQVQRMAQNFDDIMQNNILGEVVHSLINLGYFEAYFIDAGLHWVSLENEMNVLLGVNQLEGLIQESVTWDNINGRLVPTERLHITFAPPFSRADFDYIDLDSPIPALVYANNRAAFAGGYYTEVIHTEHFMRFEEGNFIEDVVRTIIPIHIIGTHNGEMARPYGDAAILIPISAMRHLQGDDMRYITLRFDIDPTFNREIHEIREELTYLVYENRRQRLHMHMTVYIRDEELRLVVGQMERNLMLLTIMYPIAVIVSVAIGTALAILLLMQHAKVAAIMRVLGNKKSYVRRKLCLEYIALVLLGATTGLVLMIIFNITFATGATVAYIGGATVGAITGAMIITSRPPLDLLQIRE